MGEIGFPRREFLYEIQFWEVRRIIRGYRRRDWLKHQLLAECAYATIYAMRDPKGKTVADIFPMLFDDDDDDDEPPITPDVVTERLQFMADINAQIQEQQESKSTAD